jgi:hypothetical protein
MDLEGSVEVLPSTSWKATKTLVQESQCPGRISNKAPHEYEIKELLLHQTAR